MSALGAREDAGATAYHRTKASGEEAVRRAGTPHVILRPAFIAGAGSVPLAMMVKLIRFAPVVPVVGDGRYLLQPIWIDDVAEAFAVAVERTELGGTFEIAGPEQLSWDRMLDELERALSVRRMRVHVPLSMVRLGALAGLVAPDLAPITPDQLQMLLEGSVTDRAAVRDAMHGGRRPRPPNSPRRTARGFPPGPNDRTRPPSDLAHGHHRPRHEHRRPERRVRRVLPPQARDLVRGIGDV